MNAEKHDFKDGRGPVPAHRHHNGGGWVEDSVYFHTAPGDPYGLGRWKSEPVDVFIHATAEVWGDVQFRADAVLHAGVRVHGKCRGSSRIGVYLDSKGLTLCRGVQIEGQFQAWSADYAKGWVIGEGSVFHDLMIDTGVSLDGSYPNKTLPPGTCLSSYAQAREHLEKHNKETSDCRCARQHPPDSTYRRIMSDIVQAVPRPAGNADSSWEEVMGRPYWSVRR